MDQLRSLAERIDAARTPDQVWHSALRCLPEMGIGKVIYMDLSKPTTASILSNGGTDWTDTYRRTVRAGLDPFARQCLTTVATQPTGIGHFQDHVHLSLAARDQIAEGSAALNIRTGMSVTIQPDPHGAGVGLNLMTDFNAAGFADLRAEQEQAWRAWCQLLHAGLRPHRAKSRRDPLSQRERDCLSYFADGLRTAEVAFRLGISQGTVELHLRKARNRLGATTRDQAVAIAVRAGLI